MIAESLSHGGVKENKERQIQWAVNGDFLLEPHLGLIVSEMVPLTGPEETGIAERKGPCLSQSIHNEWPDQHGGGGGVAVDIPFKTRLYPLDKCFPRILPWEESPEMIPANWSEEMEQGTQSNAAFLNHLLDF